MGKPRGKTHTQRYLEQARDKGIEFNPSVLDVLKAQADNQARQAIRRATTAEERRKAREDYLKRQQLERQKALDNIRGNATFKADIQIAKPPADGGPKQAPELTASKMARLRALVVERIRRRREAVKLWKPMPTQAEFHNCTAKERVIYGSNRCLGGEQKVFDPVAGVDRRVDEIHSDFNVHAYDNETGMTVVTLAKAPFIKGESDLYRVRFANGRSMVTTLGHRFLTELGWISVARVLDRQREFGRILLVSSEELCPSVSFEGASRWSEKAGDWPVGYRPCDRFDDVPPHLASDTVRAFVPLSGDARVHSQQHLQTDVQACEPGCSRPYLQSFRHASTGVATRSFREDASEYRISEGLCLQPLADGQARLRSAVSSFPDRHTSCEEAVDSSRCCAYASASRQADSVLLKHSTACNQELRQFVRYQAPARYTSEPLPFGRTFIVSVEFLRRDKFYDFEVPVYHNYWCQTTLSHNSGKTTASAVEVASICMGVHKHLSGKQMPLRDGLCMCIGYDFQHVGQVMFRKLFKPGAYRIIKDKDTGEWRPYEPDGADKGVYRSETKPAPPLIPKRMIAPGGIAWYRKKEGIPKSVKLVNGWQINFYSSESDPPQGHSANLAWVDEEMDKESWYEEIARAMTDETGYFIWSATPHVGGEALIDIHNRAERDRLKPNAMTREFFLLIHDNQHISNADKQDLIEKYKDNPEAYRTRILGQFAAKAFKVYSEFHIDRHGFDLDKLPNGQIPADWCRYAFIDPGTQVCAAGFAAIPPPGSPWQRRIYVYRELYVTNATPSSFAREFEIATRGEHFHCWLFDMRMGRVSTVGTEESVEMIYRKALAKVATGSMLTLPDGGHQAEVVSCWDRVTEKMFIPGVDNPRAGIQAVKEALSVNSVTGVSYICFARGRLPNMEMEFAKYHNRRVKGVVIDEPIKKNDHLMDGLRYLVCYRPEYHKPPQPQKPKTRIYNRLEEKRARLARAGSRVVNFGPRSSAAISY